MNPGLSEQGANFTATLYTLVGLLTLTIAVVILCRQLTDNLRHDQTRERLARREETARRVITAARFTPLWTIATRATDPADHMRARLLELRAEPRVKPKRHLTIVKAAA